ncbi:MAG: glycosyltransferase family 2 protein [Candidatus Pacearchaeota archaeon]
MKKVSIIIPVYNEEKTIKIVLEKVLKLKLNKEIIVVNDGSKDNTFKELKLLRKKIKLISYRNNQGKGYALRKGIAEATGEFIVFQDADLEYNPKEIPKLIKELKKEKVVYGSRFLKKNEKGNFANYLANIFLSFSTSVLYGQKITDMETCYKSFRKEVLKELNLVSDGFEIEPEITSKILKKKIKIKEIPISYKPRTKKEGKKIKFIDGIKAVWSLIKWKVKD